MQLPLYTINIGKEKLKIEIILGRYKLIEMTRKESKKRILFLEGVNAEEVEKRFKEQQSEDEFADYPERSDDEGVGRLTTKLSDLNTGNNIPNFITFLDPSKNKIKVWITMRDYINYGPLPERTDIWCYWCKHPFNTSPIGLPIKYYEEGEIVEYKDTLIKVPKDDTAKPTPKSSRNRKKKSKPKKNVEDDYFETYGIFCSFNCAEAYRIEKKHEPLFRESKQLLRFLYFKLYNNFVDITPAHHYEACLKVFGGKLSIKEFRKSFCKVVYTITKNIKRPFMFPCGRYVEEKDIF